MGYSGFSAPCGSLGEQLIALRTERAARFQSTLTPRHFKTICYHAKLTFLRKSLPSLRYLQIAILAFVSFFVARLNKTSLVLSQKAASLLPLFPLALLLFQLKCIAPKTRKPGLDLWALHMAIFQKIYYSQAKSWRNETRHLAWRRQGSLEVAGPISQVTPAVPDQGWSPSVCLWWGWATDLRFAETSSSSTSQTLTQLRGRDEISTFRLCSGFF